MAQPHEQQVMENFDALFTFGREAREAFLLGKTEAREIAMAIVEDAFTSLKTLMADPLADATPQDVAELKAEANGAAL